MLAWDSTAEFLSRRIFTVGELQLLLLVKSSCLGTLVPLGKELKNSPVLLTSATQVLHHGRIMWPVGRLMWPVCGLFSHSQGWGGHINIII